MECWPSQQSVVMLLFTQFAPDGWGGSDPEEFNMPRQCIADLLRMMLGMVLCSGIGCATGETAMRYASHAPAPEFPGAREDKTVPVETVRLAAGQEQPPTAGRMLIYTAGLRLVVPELEAALNDIQRIAEKARGYMQTMTSTSITIRVPAGEFGTVLDQLRQVGRMVEKNIHTQDVTDEYVDLQLRLKNAEALLIRLQEILAKTENVKDALEVEKELSRVREEVERIKGRLASLDKLISYSTIQIQLERAVERPGRYAPDTPFPWMTQLGVENILRYRQR